MKKKMPSFNDELNLASLLNVLWENKKKIILITLISFFIGVGYTYQLPAKYLNSLTVKTSDNSQFEKIEAIERMLSILQLNQINQFRQLDQTNQLDQLRNEKILLRFVKELEDYEEFFSSLKNIKKINEQIQNLPPENKKNELYKYAKLLEIDVPKNIKNRVVVKLNWNDVDEARKILQNTLDKTFNNLEESLIEDLQESFELEKKLMLNKDQNRLSYLYEQSAIAKELDIKDNQIENSNLSQSNVSLNINTQDVAYYLRGYKAIDKEIELIQNRKYDSYTLIQDEINSIKKDNIRWVNYEFFLINVTSYKNIKIILAISILLGLIISIFYVLISIEIQTVRALKEKN